MSQLLCSLVLLLFSCSYGLSDTDKVILRTLPSNGDRITCTGDLVCENTEVLCMPGDRIDMEYPVLVPSSIEAETMKKCQGDNCSLCVQLTVNISVDFLKEPIEDFGSSDCDYDYYPDNEESGEQEESDEEEEEKEGMPMFNVYLRLNSSNSSILCTHVVTSQLAIPKSDCWTMRVSLPSSSVPQLRNNSSLAVGSIVYSCINVAPSTEVKITSYTVPRYSDVLNSSYELPGCLQLHESNNIWLCGVPTLDIVDETSIGIVNETKNRTVELRVYYDYKNQILSKTVLTGQQRHNISQSDILPCLCIKARYEDLVDPVKDALICPFRNYSEERTLNKSRLELQSEKLTMYSLIAFCNVTAEASLCWKSTDQSDCKEIPNTRRTIVSQEKYPIEGLALPHSSLCVQVKAKGKVLHTECLNVSTGPLLRNEAIFVYQHKQKNVSVCQVAVEGCRILFDTTHELKRDLDFLDERMVEDAMSDQCIKVLSDSNQDVLICSPDKYKRSRLVLSRLLCLLIVTSVLLILLLKIEDLKRCLKSLTAENPLDEIFNDRRVLILYSPDSPAYEELVRVFASSLKDQRLDVVLDQWHRNDMSLINPLTWYQKQKKHVLQKGGMIILLFSEGAREKYMAWEDQKPTQVLDSDPYGTFGAVLNCIYPDFKNKRAKGSYLVACFDFFNKKNVPKLFRSLRTYTLPLNLAKLLHALARDSKKRLGRQQAKRLSAMISEELKGPMKACQDTMYRTTSINQTGSEKSESAANGVSVELQSLMSL